MASSSVRENVFLTITPTLDGVCGMLLYIIIYYILLYIILYIIIYYIIIYNNIPHTPSKVGVMVRKTFSLTLDEAMSV